MNPGSPRPEFAASSRTVAPDVVVVALAGDLDRETIEQATAALVAATAARPDHLILDLSQVVFMGSDGISLLIATHQGRLGVHGRLRLIGIADNRQVLRPLELMRLTEMLRIDRDLDAALAAISETAAPAG